MLYLLQCTEEAWCCFFCAVTIVDNALVCQCTRLAIIGHVSVYEHSCGVLQCLTSEAPLPAFGSVLSLEGGSKEWKEFTGSGRMQPL